MVQVPDAFDAVYWCDDVSDVEFSLFDTVTNIDVLGVHQLFLSVAEVVVPVFDFRSLSRHSQDQILMI